MLPGLPVLGLAYKTSASIVNPVDYDAAVMLIDLEQNRRTTAETDGAQTGPQVGAARPAFRHRRKTKTIVFDALHKAQRDRGSVAFGYIVIMATRSASAGSLKTTDQDIVHLALSA